MFENRLFKTLNIKTNDDLKIFSKKSKITTAKLKYYNDQGILPFPVDLETMLHMTGMSELELKINLGILDNSILDLLQLHSKEVSNILKKINTK